MNSERAQSAVVHQIETPAVTADRCVSTLLVLLLAIGCGQRRKCLLRATSPRRNRSGFLH
jgi:hypothetical protein